MAYYLHAIIIIIRNQLYDIFLLSFFHSPTVRWNFGWNFVVPVLCIFEIRFRFQTDPNRKVTIYSENIKLKAYM